MQAVLSATAGLAFLIDGDKFASMDADAPQDLVPRRGGDFLHLFGGASDLLFLEDVEPEEVKHRLCQATQQEDALALTLICLDSQLSPEVRRESAADLEEMFEAVGDSLANTLLAHPLPQDADLRGALHLAQQSQANQFCHLLETVRDRQDAVPAVANRGQGGGNPADVAFDIGVDQVDARRLPAGRTFEELRPIPGAIDG